MNGEARKAAIAAYKERKVQAGAYAIRCTASGQVWVGIAPDLSTIQKRIWFSLRLGGYAHRSLQEARTAHGMETFIFEVVERLGDSDDPDYVRKAALKRLHTHWVEKLDATRI
jgi:hypothetical protein